MKRLSLYKLDYFGVYGLGLHLGHSGCFDTLYSPAHCAHLLSHVTLSLTQKLDVSEERASLNNLWFIVDLLGNTGVRLS